MIDSFLIVDLRYGCLTVCITGRWAGVDSAREQKKLETRKTLENSDEIQLFSACFVGQFYFTIETAR